MFLQPRSTCKNCMEVKVFEGTISFVHTGCGVKLTLQTNRFGIPLKMAFGNTVRRESRRTYCRISPLFRPSCWVWEDITLPTKIFAQAKRRPPQPIAVTWDGLNPDWKDDQKRKRCGKSTLRVSWFLWAKTDSCSFLRWVTIPQIAAPISNRALTLSGMRVTVELNTYEFPLVKVCSRSFLTWPSLSISGITSRLQVTMEVSQMLLVLHACHFYFGGK